jgi:hypothetical protein|tara:strand:+ start:281 stop:493 length:213 start_codon:yes stop_codon:yes gene_type:complete
MVKYKKYYSWKEAVEDLQSKGVEYIGWANGGAKATKVEGDTLVSIPHVPFSNTTIYYYPLANQVMCVDMS